MSAARKVTLPSALRTRVRCDHDRTLFGLFVIHRVAGATSGFTLSFVGSDGFLQVVTRGDDPWACFYKTHRATPQASKLGRGAHEVIAVRHPDVGLARRYLDELGPEGASVEAFRAAHPGALELRDVALVTTGGKTYLTLTLPDDPAKYLPPGPALYDGWTLYRDMPHALCEPVQRAVKRLRAHLGALSYVVGIQEVPYASEAVNNAAKPAPLMPLAGVFDAGLLNAVVTFQTDTADRGRAWRVDDPEATQGAFVQRDAPTFDARAQVTMRAAFEASWKNLRARPVTAPLDATVAAIDGVVEAATGRAIQAWLKAGWRKRGAVLVGVPSSESGAGGWVYLRQEAALAVEAWRRAIVAMGCSYGLSSGHSFRAISSGVGTKERGVASQSLHKSGLAIDMSVKGTEGSQTDYAYPVAAWPIVFERSVQRSVVRDGAHNRGIHRIAWRLYGHSTVRVAGFAAPDSAARRELVAALRACGGSFAADVAGRMGLSDLTGAPAALRAEVDALTGVFSRLAAEAERAPEDFIARFFRGTVFPWHYDPYSPEAGTLGAERAPDDPVVLAYANATAATVVERPDARSFVNLSALGQRFGMLRIGAAASGWQNEAVDDENQSVYKIEQAIPAEKNLPFVLDRLEKLARSPQRDAPIRLVQADGVEVELDREDVDVDALQAWLFAIHAARTLSRQPPVSLSGAQVSIDLALGPASVASVDSLLASMEGALEELPLRLTSGVDFAPDGLEGVSLDEVGVKPAKVWAGLIRSLRERLDAALKARAKGASTRRSTPKRKGDWSIELHPMVISGRDDVLFMAPGQRVILPASGTGRALEWWHFQHVLANERGWFDLLEDIGFSPEALAPGRSPELHRRAGLGYDPKNWHSRRHGAPRDEVENQMRDIDRASVLHDAPLPPAKKQRGRP